MLMKHHHARYHASRSNLGVILDVRRQLLDLIRLSEDDGGRFCMNLVKHCHLKGLLTFFLLEWIVSD